MGAKLMSMHCTVGAVHKHKHDISHKRVSI